MEVISGAEDESTASPIPTPLLSDYVEMAYLGLVLLIGVPINLHVLFKLLKQKEKTATYSVKRGFLILKINLNISDTFILFINAGGKLGWLATYEWIAGDFMCRFYKFSSIATLYLSSNIVVCIALDRLRTVLGARQLRRENSVFLTKAMVVAAWGLALVSSLPQLFAFQTFDILQSLTNPWYQCTDIWAVNEHLVGKGILNATDTFPFTESTKNFHELFHLFMVFYGPLIAMAICYFIIAVKLTNYSKERGETLHITGDGKSKYLKPALTFEPDDASEVSRISLESTFGEPRRGPLTFWQFLKREFSYCACLAPAGHKAEEIGCQKLSGRHLLADDPVSTTSTTLFTWTPLLQQRKLASDSHQHQAHHPRLSSFHRLQRLTLRRGGGNNKKQASLPRQPAWRRQLRSRVFKTTLLVVITHLIFWLPYNFISLLRFVSEDLHTSMRNHMNIFEDLQFLIAIVNPFLYGFAESLARNQPKMSGIENVSAIPEMPDRFTEDYIEIIYLSVIIFLGIVLNTGVFVQLMRQSRAPTASTSFLTGPYQLSSFNLFKMHLCLTDFAIVLVHALGKLIWISTLDWRMGGLYGCKLYQFLSAFTYYANNNVIISIGLDRLKVVYTSHIQGATSVRRVRNLLIVSWSLSALCSLPQLYVWKTIQLKENYVQCTTFWQIALHQNQSSEFLETTQMLYEMSHQAFVFWIPFITLLCSYLLIVLRIVHYTLHPIHTPNPNSNHRRKQAPGNKNRAATSIFLENRLLSNSVDNFPSEYHFSYSAATERTEMSVGDQSTRSLPVRLKSGKPSRVSLLSRIRNHCDCLLAGTAFSQRIVDKRQAVCCGSAVRACCLSTDTGNFRPLGLRKPPSGSPLWRRQLRSRIFITSLAIVTTHFLLWLPYNLLNTLRFIHQPSHSWLQDRGANLLEDLIVLSSILNPILYAYEQK